MNNPANGTPAFLPRLSAYESPIIKDFSKFIFLLNEAENIPGLGFRQKQFIFKYFNSPLYPGGI